MFPNSSLPYISEQIGSGSLDRSYVYLYVFTTLLSTFFIHFILLMRCPKSEESNTAAPNISLGGVTCTLVKAFSSRLPFLLVVKSTIFEHLHSICFKVLRVRIELCHGGNAIADMLNEKGLSNAPLACHLVQHVFCMSHEVALAHYTGSNPNDMHRTVHELNRRYLTGSGAISLETRFQQQLKETMINIHTEFGSTWVYDADFFHFFRQTLTKIVLDSSFGPALLESSPDLIHDFWTFSDHLAVFVARIPRFCALSIFRARDRALEAVRRWQENTFSENRQNQSTEREPWIPTFFEKRYRMMQKLDEFDPVSMAGLELSFMYALNANAIIVSFWCALEVFKDTALLRAVRKEVESCAAPGHQLNLDTQQLLQMPYLQAVYAETLRIRGHGLFIRHAIRDVQLRGRFLPKGSIAVASSSPGHLDSAIWERNGAPPVDRFSVHRFLQNNGDKISFSTKGLDGSWLPFGGGWNMCPGRNFAKLQAITTTAIMVSAFDCEILTSESKIGMSVEGLGVGVLGPVGKIAYRIRQRHPAFLAYKY